MKEIASTLSIVLAAIFAALLLYIAGYFQLGMVEDRGGSPSQRYRIYSHRWVAVAYSTVARVESKLTSRKVYATVDWPPEITLRDVLERAR